MSLADHQQGRAAKFESTYPLTPGKQYAVAGMGIIETVFHFLIRDDEGEPLFAPAGMFDLVESPMPPNWRFALGPGVQASGRNLWVEPVVATWGYPELVIGPEHYVALMDGDPEAMAVFERSLAESVAASS